MMKKNFKKAWQLNERHYGALTGLNKIEMSKKIGEEKVHEFRRSWDINLRLLKRKVHIIQLILKLIKRIPREIIPDTESLKDTYERVTNILMKKLKKN